MNRVAAAAAATLAIGCGGGEGRSVGTTADAAATEAGTAPPQEESDGGNADGAGGGSATDAPSCGAAERYVYVLSGGLSAPMLLRFDSQAGTLAYQATVRCPGESTEVPVAMALGHDGSLDVAFRDGRVFHARADTGICSAAGAVDACGGQACRLGLAFAGEALFATTGTTPPTLLQLVDPTTLAMSPIGPLVPSLVDPRLAGTPDGRLFALTVQAGLHLQTIDPHSGAVADGPTLTDPSLGVAFAQWGGDLWFFGNAAGKAHVARVTLPAGSVAQSWDVDAPTNDGFAAAAASTCAP